MAKKKIVIELTSAEAHELTSLLTMVLSNSDQWAFMNLGALRRIDKKMAQ